MKKNYQMIHTYRFEATNAAGKPTPMPNEVIGKVQTERSSFNTLDNAISKAVFWINKEEPWIYTTALEIVIKNKETKEVLWTYVK